jgi:hypothetical protein
MFEALCPRIRCSGIRTRASSLRIQTKKRTPSDRSFLERPTFLKILQVARIELALKCLQETVGAADAQWGYGTKYDTNSLRALTKDWDRPIVDRTKDLRNWVALLKQMVNDKRIRKLFAYANNHYALCRCRHKAYYAASRIMPKPLMSSAPFPFHSCLSTHTDA